MPGDDEAGADAAHPRARALRITVWLLALMFCVFAALLGVAAGSAAGLAALGLFSLSMALGLLVSERTGAMPYKERTASLQPIAWIMGAAAVLGVVGVIVRVAVPASPVSSVLFVVALALAVLSAVGAVAMVTR